MIERFAENVWTITRPQAFWGVETGTRTTIVRLSSGGLFVCSPVALDAELRASVDALGDVVAIVAPSIFHHLYAGAWKAAYPSARIAACPGLEIKRADLAWDEVLGDTPDSIWAADLEQVYFSARRENEVDFFHRASGTLICTDALLNLARHPSRRTRAVARLTGNTAPGFGYLERFMIRDRRVARRQVDRMLEWPIAQIILAHGDLVHEDGREVLRRAYAWL